MSLIDCYSAAGRPRLPRFAITIKVEEPCHLARPSIPSTIIRKSHKSLGRAGTTPSDFDNFKSPWRGRGQVKSFQYLYVRHFQHRQKINHRCLRLPIRYNPSIL